MFPTVRAARGDRAAKSLARRLLEPHRRYWLPTRWATLLLTLAARCIEASAPRRLGNVRTEDLFHHRDLYH
ncbi:hypothetical protein IscW_ISCW015918 [Ixodes scapularis]|uniref:Uncharacterized protein n=1 Tax=Ixodes scapularis TaxID=6945 RepID=B7P232_IXOSC|nr:hypothetical protein IscW_ISCW015918 [Ixodes scapularis]|eukprot:XP_002401392.1 hypothetical protein IscW_ISCW015918 [Ixodes scapularis]